MNAYTKIDMQQAAEMWADDKSIGDIADHFGMTRNSISGLMNRNRDLFPKKTDGKMDLNPNGQKGLPGRAKGDRRPYTRINPQNIHRARQEAVRREVGEFKAGASPLLQIAPSDEILAPAGKDLMELGHNECRWPTNNGHPFLFCAEATDGKTYCSHHTRRAYRVRDE